METKEHSIVQFLIQAGAQVDVHMMNGSTLVHLSAGLDLNIISSTFWEAGPESLQLNMEDEAPYDRGLVLHIGAARRLSGHITSQGAWLTGALGTTDRIMGRLLGRSHRERPGASRQGFTWTVRQTEVSGIDSHTRIDLPRG